MRFRAMLLVFVTSLLLSTGYAAAESAQQANMKMCNAQATQQALIGARREEFMKRCLSSSDASAKENSRHEKMKTCNADATAKGLKGDARNAFISSCMLAK